ncbi:hypothetical protein B0T17DRAFT_590492 [Bombardia bombarda]|uniref:Uncharacterized protein n=1 Tax=Bombardia bombarda TaxID=252184 RepID=A0AA39WZS0_9PEZI|nr:hypothetical protein B0T17DRAFT_590492 [Bombardia bombarda]
MPPRLPRPSASGHHRPDTTDHHPPASPKFIKVPEPPQSSDVKLTPIKGHLPVPRQIFTKREGNKKVKPGYLERILPLSDAEKAGQPPVSENEARHRRLAESRRQSLAAGLQGLWLRKKQQDHELVVRSTARFEANLAAATAPEGLDDVLTRPTVSAHTATTTTVRLRPGRIQRAQNKREKHAALLQRKAEERQDALGQLYVKANQFIVDEAALEQEVDKIFTERSHNQGTVDEASPGSGGKSIWDSQGVPAAVLGAKTEMTGRSATIYNQKKSEDLASTPRQMSVAEELTGGRLL